MFECAGVRKAAADKRPYQPNQRWPDSVQHRTDITTFAGISKNGAAEAQTLVRTFEAYRTLVDYSASLEEKEPRTAQSVRASMADKTSLPRSLAIGDLEPPTACSAQIEWPWSRSDGSRCQHEVDAPAHDPVSLNNMAMLIEELKAQIGDLQNKASDQNGKIALLQSEVLELKMVASSRDVAAKAEEAVAPTGTTLPISPKRGRLSYSLGRVFSRSPSRSTSPQKKIRVEFEESGSMEPSPGMEPSLGCTSARSGSPERCHSPSRKIEARLAPRILDNVTNFVDSQIQNLELRMAHMETSWENYRLATIPDGAVDGMSPADLQMLSGLNVVKSCPDDLQLLLDASSESVWGTPSCSVKSKLGTAESVSMCNSNVIAKKQKSSTRKAGPACSDENANCGKEPLRGKACSKASSWRRFSPVSGLFRRQKGRA